LERGRLELCDLGIRGSKQPFHEAGQMEFGLAEVFIQRCRSESEKLARRAVATLAERHGTLVGCCLLDASGRRLPGLKDVLSSHALIHAAEGEFYRAVVARAVEGFGIGVERIRERDLEAAAEQLPGSPHTAVGSLKDLASKPVHHGGRTRSWRRFLLGLRLRSGRRADEKVKSQSLVQP
jgi:hypothetical protein